MTISRARCATTLALAIALGVVGPGWAATRTVVTTSVLSATPAAGGTTGDATAGPVSLHVAFGAQLHESVRGLRELRLERFPVEPGLELDLDLEPFQITSSGTRIVAMTEVGEMEVPLPDITLLRGHIVDAPQSQVFLTVTPQRVYGVITSGSPDGRSYLLFPEEGRGKAVGPIAHTVQSFEDLRGIVPPEPSSCGVQSDGADVPVELPSFEAKRFVFRTCRIALECDYELWDRLGQDMDAFLANTFAVWGTISQMYERDADVKLALSYLRVWMTSADPYSYVGGAIDGLREFETYWRANHNPGQPAFVDRNLAHLRSGRGVGAWAEVGVLCSYQYGFSISGGQGWPTGFWHDICFVGHEIGHNFDAIHTHCFNPPLDQCATDPGCNQTVDCSTTPSTIMSYCHNCPGAYSNILAEFAPANVTRIRAEIDASCLGLSRDPVYVDWRNGGAEDGTFSNPYNTVSEGAWYVIPGGNVSIADGTYHESQAVFFQPMTLKGRNGTVIIGP
jgi:hypothetical protein